MRSSLLQRGGAGVRMLGLLLLAALAVGGGVTLFVLREPPLPDGGEAVPPPRPPEAPPPPAVAAYTAAVPVALAAKPGTGPAVARRPTAMAEFLRRLSQVKSAAKPGGTEDALMSLGRELALEDFANAIRLMSAVSDSGTKLALCRGIFELQGVMNPQEALRQASLLAPGAAGGTATARIDAAHSRQVYYEALRSTLRGWAVQDPAAAAAHIGALPPEYQATLAETVYGVWARSNPEGALRGAGALPAAMQPQVLSQVCQSWTEQDPQAAWAYASSLPPENLPGRAQVLADIATAWARQDPGAAVIAVGRTIDDQGLYAWTLDRMVKALASQAPDKAAEMFAAVPGLAARQGETLTAALSQWVSKDPVAAAQWALAVESEEVQGQAVKAVASYWASADPAAALTWASALRDPMDRAYALSNVAIQQGQKNPAASTDWIDRQSDPFIRARCLAGYVMGRVRRGGDGQSASALRDTIASDQIDYAAVADLVRQSRIADAEKTELIALLQ